MGAPSANPFDFSDFGQRVPTTLAGSRSRPAGPGIGGGFDPFAADSSPIQRGTAVGGEAFADSGTEQPAIPATAHPPAHLVFMALAVAVAGIAASAVAALTETSIALAFVGWLLAGPAAIGGLALFTGVDTRRRSRSVYSAPTWLPRIYWLAVVACGIGIGAGAWQLALWAGRQ